MTENNQNNNEQEEVSLYEKFIARTEEILDSGKKNLDEALKKAGDELTSAGSFTREQSEKISAFVKRDIQHAVDNAGKASQSLKASVDPKRVAAGAQSLFSRILSSTAETLSDWAKKSEQQLEFKTGEITSPGSLTCKNCTEQIHMKKTARIPPCPRCHQTLFRKSY
jgi:glutamyl/glutaminyl-tRNA synthetase